MEVSQDSQRTASGGISGLPNSTQRLFCFTVCLSLLLLSLSLMYYLVMAYLPSNTDGTMPTQQTAHTIVQHVTIQHIIVENHTTVVVIDSASIFPWAALLVLVLVVLAYMVVVLMLPSAASRRKSTDGQVKDGV